MRSQQFSYYHNIYHSFLHQGLRLKTVLIKTYNQLFGMIETQR